MMIRVGYSSSSHAVHGAPLVLGGKSANACAACGRRLITLYYDTLRTYHDATVPGTLESFYTRVKDTHYRS